jgi:hypothetical protein
LGWITLWDLRIPNATEVVSISPTKNCQKSKINLERFASQILTPQRCYFLRLSHMAAEPVDIDGRINQTICAISLTQPHR